MLFYSGEQQSSLMLYHTDSMVAYRCIKQNDCVVLDFTGVDVVSNSFADKCIAKLLLVMSLSELKSRTAFRGLNPVASESVLTALRRRHLTIA